MNMKVARNNTLEHRPKASRTLLWIILIVISHCSIWFTYYGRTALGESPALDNRQTLLLAEQMALGTQAPEPYHRAPLYPFILSLFIRVGVSMEAMPLIARLLNLAALLIITFTSAKAAAKLWNSSACAWIAGLSTGLNPVYLFFAGDAFPILLGTACGALAFYQLLNWRGAPSLSRTLLISILLTLAAALRSHFLCLAIVWPVAALILSPHRKLLAMLAGAFPVGLSFLMLGLSNLSNSGEFRMMPWQGSFIVWASNGPHAQGRIYTQQIRVDFGVTYDNPSKIESIELYERETGESPPHGISEMNAYWKNKTLEYIADHPADWTLLMFRKAYYFLNNYEQYDNKTYGFHKAHHLQLRLNPIHWGALLLLAVAGAIAGLTQRETRFFTTCLIIIFAIYAAGTILFCTPNRYRLPMIPILSILAGGIILLPSLWSRASKAWRVALISCAFLTSGITYTTFFDASKKNTWEEDYALLANACLRSGKDADSIKWAGTCLGMNPSRSDMQAVLLQAHFNTWAFNSRADQPSAMELEDILKRSGSATEMEPNLIPITGIYDWKLRKYESAVQIWQHVASSDALARLCLIHTGHASAPDGNELLRYRDHPSFSLLLAYLSSDQSTETGRELTRFMDALLSPAVPNHTNDPSDET